MDATGLLSTLLATLNRMERRMNQVQADDRLFPYVQQAHALATQLNGRMLEWQGRLGQVPEENIP